MGSNSLSCLTSLRSEVLHPTSFLNIDLNALLYFYQMATLQVHVQPNPLRMSTLRLVLLFGCFSFIGLTSCNEDEPVTEVEPSQLHQAMLGTWELTDAPAARSRLKYWGLNRWTITDFNTATGEVIFHHGGTYTLDGTKYAETIVFATEATQDLIGTTHNFEIEIKGDTFTQRGTDNSFTEELIRLK